MVALTPLACERLLSKLARKKAAPDEALRIKRRRGGWRLCVDHAQADDTTLAHGGRNVLLLDAKVTQALTDMTLDVEQTPTGPRLRLRRSPVAE